MMIHYILILILLIIDSYNAQTQASLLIVDEVPIVHSNALPSPGATSNVRFITVYIPAAAVDNPSQRFPSIYYLPGLGGTNMSFAAANQGLLDDLVAEGEARSMIVVHVDPSLVDGIDTDGKRRYLGTWYVNSELNGDFENFMILDLIPYVDAHYPTIASNAFRAVMGQSMGGYGSLFHCITHPELYCALGSASGTPFWAIADNVIPGPPQDQPGLDIFTINSLILPEIPTTGPDAGKVTPDNGPLSFSIFSYSAAFSPNVNKPPYFVDLPFEVDEESRPIFANGNFIIADPIDGHRTSVSQSLIPRPEILALWKAHDPYFLLDDHIETLKRQSSYMDGGNQELINAAGARVLSDKLSNLGIDHLYILYRGGHTTCLESELCSRHRTMFQMMSNQFARAGIFADDVRTRFVGNSSITLQNNSSVSINNKALVGIETAPDLGISETNCTITIQDNAMLQIGTDTIDGGALQIGNRFTKAVLQGNPSLENHIVNATITLNGPGAILEIGRQGIFGVGVGVDGNRAPILNFSSITSLTNLKSFTLNLEQGIFIANQISSGTQSSSSLVLIGPSDTYTIQTTPASANILGGSNIVKCADCLWRHPVVLNQAGENEPGGILNNLDTNPNAKDFFYQIIIGSTLVYDDIINVGTLTSLDERDDEFEEGHDPFDLIDGTIDEAYDFLSIDAKDDYFDPNITSKEGALAIVDGIIVLTYIDNGMIVRVTEANIPVAPGQNIDLRAIAQRNGSVLIKVIPIEGVNTLVRVDDPQPPA